jgi:Lipase (class 3)
MYISGIFNKSNHLRHLVAVDHANQSIVLAIRGTYTISEIIVDVAGFSRPFYGGEAHSEMAHMAERLWDVASPTILDLLRTYPNYEFVLTGHSLGAGVASLLNIMCHDNDQALLMSNNTTKIRCFLYACPPTYTPIENFPDDAIAVCTNYIHGNDVVPFLSVDTIRHLFQRIRALDEQKLSWMDRMRYIRQNIAIVATSFVGSTTATTTRTTTTIPESILDAVRTANINRLDLKPGAPLLMIPASNNVWMKEILTNSNPRPDDSIDDSSSNSAHDTTTTTAKSSSRLVSSTPQDEYDYKICSSPALAQLGIYLDTKMLSDHFPSRYEHAFHHLQEAIPPK